MYLHHSQISEKFSISKKVYKTFKILFNSFANSLSLLLIFHRYFIHVGSVHGNQKCLCEVSHHLFSRELTEEAFCHQQVFKFRLVKVLYRYCFRRYCLSSLYFVMHSKLTHLRNNINTLNNKYKIFNIKQQ